MARNGFHPALMALDPEASSDKPIESPDGLIYAVSTPNGESFMVQANNERAARKAARECLNVSRLPVGTTVTRN